MGSNPTGVYLIGWGDSRACSAAPHYAGFRLLTIEARSGSLERAAAKGGISPPCGDRAHDHTLTKRILCELS